MEANTAMIVIFALVVFGCAMCLAYCSLRRRFKKLKACTTGDKWNHKGTVHITHADDGIYMTLELNDNNSLAEIEHNGQVVFDIKIHDTSTR